MPHVTFWQQPVAQFRAAKWCRSVCLPCNDRWRVKVRSLYRFSSCLCSAARNIIAKVSFSFVILLVYQNFSFEVSVLPSLFSAQ
jgi:hypothetical protein